MNEDRKHKKSPWCCGSAVLCCTLEWGAPGSSLVQGVQHPSGQRASPTCRHEAGVVPQRVLGTLMA